MYFIELDHVPEQQIIKGYHGTPVHTGTFSLMYWRVDEGAVMPVHFHIQEQVAHVLSGKFELTVDGTTKILEPGIIAVIPANTPHGGRALTECKLLDVFHPEREDYKFA